MNDKDAREFLDDCLMREGLMRFLWSFKQKQQEKDGVSPQPFVMFDDDQIQKELIRILFPRKRRF